MLVPPDEWIIRGQSAAGPVSWVWGSNDDRDHRSYLGTVATTGAATRCCNFSCPSRVRILE